MTVILPQALPPLVDRVEELARFGKALNEAKGGKGQLLLVRGEAGIGKTRLVQEVRGEAERRGFASALGTAYSESLKPYHPWRDLLRDLGLSHLLEEYPPPKLMALYAWTRDGLVPTERAADETDSASLRSLRTEFEDIVRESRLPSDSVSSEGGLSWIDHGPYQLFIQRDEDCSIGAVIHGKADEVFLSDLCSLADRITSGPRGKRPPAKPSSGVLTSVAALLRGILESGKYEGIDYARKDPKLRQARLFENISLGLTRTAELRPVLAVLDDLQWADPSSLALLSYAARNTRGSNVLLLGAYRMEEGGVRPHLRDALQRMTQEELSSEVSIEGLRREDLDGLVESFSGPCAFPVSFIDSLWRETQGNPLFVREVLRGLEEDGAVQVHGAAKRLVRPVEQLALSRRVREIIRARLVRLSKEDRELLDAAAACGTRFTAALVAGVAGEGEVKVLQGLNGIARVHGLLRPEGEEFAFNHALVHEVVYEDMSEEARREYHRQAAEWIETVGGPQEDVAFHYLRSTERERALPLLLNLAELAASQFSNAEAARFYSEALEFEHDANNRLRILESVGDLYDLAGDYREALACYEGVRDLATLKEKKAESLAKIAKILQKKGEYEESLGVCGQALALVNGEESMEEAMALNNIGIVHLYQGHFDQALDYHRKSLEIREKIGDQPGIARSLNSLGHVHHSRGDYEKAMDSYQKSLEIRERIGDQQGISASLHNLGNVHRARADYEQALDFYRRSLEIAEKMGDQQGIAITLNGLGSVYVHRGDYEQAVDFYRKSLRILERIGDQREIAGSLNDLGNVHADLGDNERALDCHRRSLGIAEKIGDQPGIALSLNSLGLVHADRGDYEQAVDSYQKSLEIAERIGDQSGIASSLNNLGSVHHARGDYEKAMHSYRKSLKIREKLGDEHGIASSLNHLGNVHQALGDHEQALDSYRKSLEISEKIGDQLGIACSLNDLGSLHAERGDPNLALSEVERGLKIAEGARDRRMTLVAQLSVAQIHLRMGGNEKAREVCNLAFAESTRAGRRPEVSESQRILGMVNRSLKDWSESTRNFEESIRTSNEIGSRFREGKSRYEFGLMWQEKGETGKAMEHLSGAAGIFQEIGALKELERARAALQNVSG